jgi:cytochrome c-type biogenesis protein CcmH/NrfG
MRTKLMRVLWLGAVALTCSVLARGQAPSDSVAEARAMLDAGKTQEPETILRKYLADNPSSADAHFLLGYALFRQQKAE